MIEDKSTDGSGAAFWRSALAIYERPGRAAALLDLQDRHSADIMAVLWAMTAVEAGRHLEVIDIEGFYSETASARTAASAARARRRRLKDGDPAAYAEAKQAELAAERAVAAAAPDPLTAGRPADGVALDPAALAEAFSAASPAPSTMEAVRAYRKMFDSCDV